MQTLFLSLLAPEPAAMLSYKVAYRMQMGTFFAEVPDFPEASALGTSLPDARGNLLAALAAAAERKLRRGDSLPHPDPHRNLSDVYFVETVTLVPIDADRVEARVEDGRN